MVCETIGARAVTEAVEYLCNPPADFNTEHLEEIFEEAEAAAFAHVRPLHPRETSFCRYLVPKPVPKTARFLCLPGEHCLGNIACAGTCPLPPLPRQWWAIGVFAGHKDVQIR